MLANYRVSIDSDERSQFLIVLAISEYFDYIVFDANVQKHSYLC